MQPRILVLTRTERMTRFVMALGLLAVLIAGLTTSGAGRALWPRLRAAALGIGAPAVCAARPSAEPGSCAR